MGELLAAINSNVVCSKVTVLVKEIHCYMLFRGPFITMDGRPFKYISAHEDESHPDVLNAHDFCADCASRINPLVYAMGNY